LFQIYTVTFVDEDNASKFPAKRFYIIKSTPLPPTGVDLPFTIDENTGRCYKERVEEQYAKPYHIITTITYACIIQPFQ